MREKGKERKNRISYPVPKRLFTIPKDVVMCWMSVSVEEDAHDIMSRYQETM